MVCTPGYDPGSHGLQPSAFTRLAQYTFNFMLTRECIKDLLITIYTFPAPMQSDGGTDPLALSGSTGVQNQASIPGQICTP